MIREQSSFVFFGTPEFASIILDELEAKGYLPSLIVTAPDKPRGRGLVITPSEVRVWGTAHNIPVITPSTLRDDGIATTLRDAHADFFVVAAYGKIIPKNILEIPPHGVLNVHPSLLPKFRGSSPIESAILSDEPHTGVSIMLLDEEMDHGPVITQRERIIKDWPPKGSLLTRDLAHFGGALLAEIIPEWLSGLKAGPQDHSKATFTKKITKEDGLIDLADDPVKNLKKVRALDEWPGTYTFVPHEGKSIRLKILDAKIEEGKFVPTRVIPEGKKEMDYQDFLRGLR
jgi:methionyl-tRNA formyltransferase